MSGLQFFGEEDDDEVILDDQAETAFDQIVGAIEDIVVDDRFQDLQTDLLEKHFHHFDVSTRVVILKKCNHTYKYNICQTMWIKITLLSKSSEENKLIYTDIFNEYTVEIEKYIEAALVQVYFYWVNVIFIDIKLQKMPNFHMDAFLEELNGRRNELDGDIFEMLYTLSGDQAVIYLEMGDPPSFGPVPMGPIPIS